MKTFINIQILIAMLMGTFISSCHKVYIYEGKAIVLNKTSDLTLNDSVLIIGNVYSAYDTLPEFNAIVWIDGTNIKTSTDSLGYFSIKLPPGTYTIKCHRSGDTGEQPQVLKDIQLLPNEKLKVEFLLRVEIT